jgi:hypothetical protein
MPAKSKSRETNGQAANGQGAGRAHLMRSVIKVDAVGDAKLGDAVGSDAGKDGGVDRQCNDLTLRHLEELRRQAHLGDEREVGDLVATLAEVDRERRLAAPACAGGCCSCGC